MEIITLSNDVYILRGQKYTWKLEAIFKWVQLTVLVKDGGEKKGLKYFQIIVIIWALGIYCIGMFNCAPITTQVSALGDNLYGKLRRRSFEPLSSLSTSQTYNSVNFKSLCNSDYTLRF